MMAIYLLSNLFLVFFFSCLDLITDSVNFTYTKVMKSGTNPSSFSLHLFDLHNTYELFSLDFVLNFFGLKLEG